MSLNLERDRTFVICDAGTCHANKDPEARFRRSMKYVHAAVRARVDCIKFQMFIDPCPQTMFCWMEGDEQRAARWRNSAMPLEDWRAVKDEAESCGIMFLASAFEYESVKWLSELEVQATKVASRAAGYLGEFADAPRPLLISNGMVDVGEYDGHTSIGSERVILECEAKYPSTARWQESYPGFSDHSGTPWRAIDAIARRCKLLEVHFYLDPLHAGPDLKASLTIEDLELICTARDHFEVFHNEQET